MTAFLPPNLLALFAPRDPIPYLPPVDKLCHEKKKPTLIGVAQFLKEFEDPKDTPPPTRVETKDERKERKKKERNEQIAYKLEQDLALWDPANDPEGTSDPFKTLFVARINFDTSESKLRREFEVYGPIRKIRQVHNQSNGKVRGFAFIEYEHERDMHSAYKHADGKKIDARRVLVDVERGRTVKGWRPRRLGGGLGGTRKGGPEENTRFSGRDEFSAGGGSGGGSGGGGFGGREERGRERSRSREREPRDREPRRRSRSRERKRRSRSRSPKRRRSRERRPREREEIDLEAEENRVRKKSRRSRSREHKRSKSPRDRKPRRGHSRERRDRRPEEGGEGPMHDDKGDLILSTRIKLEKEEETERYGVYPGPEATREALNGAEIKEEPDTTNQFEEQYGDY